jgi:hypothetical protein
MNLKTLATATKTNIAEVWRGLFPAAAQGTRERGGRVATDIALQRAMKNAMFVDYDRRALVALMREMDQRDGRVKMIHSRVSRDVVRGGLVMQYGEKDSSQTLKDEWERFEHRLQLNRSEKLRSDARGLVVEGNLPLQLVLDNAQDVVAAVRMPSDTICPIVADNGRFKDPARAFEQRDVMTGQVQASFAAWQLALCRLDPDNFDDMGSMGRPWMDACAATWRKLMMTEEDLVIRRRVRAPLRLAHVLEGADEADLMRYRQSTEGEKGEITTDFYLNRKGTVQAIQGDATLGDIGDVAHLLDTFFAGTSAPKGLFGYTNGMARDILEDLKRDYYAEVDGLQDLQAGAYAFAFRIHLLFKGIDPGPSEFHLRFAERRTESNNQVADLALKYQALMLPDDLIYTEMGFDADRVRAMKTAQGQRNDPYPNPLKVGPDGLPLTAKPATNVSVTPGNARKGESGTAVSQPGGNGGRGRN